VRSAQSTRTLCHSQSHPARSHRSYSWDLTRLGFSGCRLQRTSRVSPKIESSDQGFCVPPCIAYYTKLKILVSPGGSIPRFQMPEPPLFPSARVSKYSILYNSKNEASPDPSMSFHVPNNYTVQNRKPLNSDMSPSQAQKSNFKYIRTRPIPVLPAITNTLPQEKII
jgi:hypothetical protein